MAKNLNLDANWLDDETLRVSWLDVKANDNNILLTVFVPLIGVCMFFYGMFVVITGGGFGLFIFGILFTIGAIFWSRIGSTSVENHVDFTAQTVRHGGRTYPTNDITRFEYGVRSALTGQAPMRDGQGDPMSDPSLIRMWVKDSYAEDISQNAWQNQVNHKIRDALAKALETVRNMDKQQEHEEKFGKVSDDTGMPEY